MEGGVDSFLYIFHPYGVKDKKAEFAFREEEIL